MTPEWAEKAEHRLQTLCQFPFNEEFVLQDLRRPCFWPSPTDAITYMSSRCVNNTGLLVYNMKLNVNISLNPYSCIVSGKCEYIYDPMLIVCWDHILDDDDVLLEMLAYAKLEDHKFHMESKSIYRDDSEDLILLVFIIIIFFFSLSLIISIVLCLMHFYDNQN